MAAKQKLKGKISKLLTKTRALWKSTYELNEYSFMSWKQS